MTRLEWGVPGSKYYEFGVDRGVVYVDGGAGVSWNGLVSINEEPSNVSITPRYIDGYKYSNHADQEDYAYTIEALNYPDVFYMCEGIYTDKDGLQYTGQHRKEFNLTYRTIIGDDLSGEKSGYKLHLIYNSKAEPTSRSNQTKSASNQLINFSWKAQTRPIRIPGAKPSPHITIDSRYVPDVVMKRIEDILYGTDSESPRFPSINELKLAFLISNSAFPSSDNTYPSLTLFPEA